MTAVYEGNWSDKADVERDFGVSLENEEILFASYEYGDYDGTSFVLLRRGDKLFEVNSSHCSCFGLEGTWDPEETTKEALIKRNSGVINRALETL